MTTARPAKNICVDCTLQELWQLLSELADDESVDKLLGDPQEFFQGKGYTFPHNARVYAVPAHEYQRLLEDPNSRLYPQDRAASFDVHVPKGKKGGCTHITVT